MTQWTDDMDEISGFGGGYEAHCRALALECVKWLEANRAALVFNDDGSFRFGGADEEAKAAYDRMCDHIDAVTGHQSTGAQVGAAASHGCYIFARGWEAYAARMRQRKAGGLKN